MYRSPGFMSQYKIVQMMAEQKAKKGSKSIIDFITVRTVYDSLSPAVTPSTIKGIKYPTKIQRTPIILKAVYDLENMKFNKYVKLITEIPKHSKINRMIYQAGIRASIEKINSKTINPMAGSKNSKQSAIKFPV